MSKVCSNCNLLLELDRFYFRYNKYVSQCKDCQYKKNKDYKKNNQEKLKIRDSLYYQKNKDYINERNKNYLSENREKRNSYIREYRKKKNAQDPSFKIYNLLRKRIWRCVKKNNKSNISKQYLGCDLDFYKKWLEYTFTDNMNWENHGIIWHIDHIIPINYFDLTNNDHIKIAFNWKNTRSLSIIENLQKKNNIIFEDIKRHDNILKSFLSEIDNPQPSNSEMS